MKRTPAVHGLLIASLVLGSCATLTKSQLTEVNAFGRMSAHFSAYPGTVVSTYNRIHEQQELLKANSISDPDAHIDAISGAYNFKKITSLITPKIDLSFKIIDQYAHGLVLLTSDKYSIALDTATQSLGSNLDGLIVQYNRIEPGAPLKTGIGSAISALIQLGGNAYIRKKQAEEVRKIVPEADKVIAKMTANMLDFLDPADAGNTSLKGLIEGEKDRVKDSYKRFLNPYVDHILTGGQNDSSAQWGNIEHRRFTTLADDQVCLQLLEDLDNAELLRQQCVAAVKSLRAAHLKLKKDVEQKQSLENIADEIQGYGDDLKNMVTTIKSIK